MDFKLLSGQLDLFPYQKLFFTTFRYKELVPVFKLQNTSSIKLEKLGKEESILLLTGIASPKQMMQDLQTYTKRIELFAFGDHHDFTRKDMEELEKRFDRMDGINKIIVTTEKDAARLINHPYLSEKLKPFMYALPIEVCFLQNQEVEFNDYILGYIRKNKRNKIDSRK